MCMASSIVKSILAMQLKLAKKVAIILQNFSFKIQGKGSSALAIVHCSSACLQVVLDHPLVQ